MQHSCTSATKYTHAWGHTILLLNTLVTKKSVTGTMLYECLPETHSVKLLNCNIPVAFTSAHCHTYQGHRWLFHTEPGAELCSHVPRGQSQPQEAVLQDGRETRATPNKGIVELSMMVAVMYVHCCAAEVLTLCSHTSAKKLHHQRQLRTTAAAARLVIV